LSVEQNAQSEINSSIHERLHLPIYALPPMTSPSLLEGAAGLSDIAAKFVSFVKSK
jgi:hypothetical protein